MGVLDQIEKHEKRRSRILLVLVLLALAAAGGAYLALRQRAGDTGQRVQDAPMPPEAIQLGGGRGGLRPAALEFFDKSRSVSADGAEIGREIDKFYSYPQRMGIDGLRITFTSDFIDQQLRVWLRNYGGTEEDISKIYTEIFYIWGKGNRPELKILGWPKEMQPLEVERHERTLLKMAELIIPTTQEEFLRDYAIRVERNDKGMVVWGERVSPDGALEEFYKYYSPNRMITYIEGEGAHASFETLTKYQNLEGRIVADLVQTWVDTPNKILRYDVEPVYGKFENVWLAAQITQTYMDPETGEVEGLPLSMVLKELEIDAVAGAAGQASPENGGGQ